MLFTSIDAMWFQALNDIKSHGDVVESRDGPCREILGYAATLTDPSFCLLQNEGRLLDPCYAAAEIMWYMAGERRIDFIKFFAPQYSRFADPDGTAYGAYGNRLFRYQHMVNVMTMLRDNPLSRQCVVPLYDSDDLAMANYGQKDIPCTTSFQFLVRDGKLHLIVTMRSNDVWLGMPYDVFWWCTFQRLVAWELGLELGYYHHRAGSMHLYDRDEPKTAAVRQLWSSLPSWTVGKESFSSVRETASYIVNEQGSPMMTGPMSWAFANLCRMKQNNGPMPLTIDEPLLVLARRKYDSDRGA